jgi:hypothetical protein
MSEPIKPCPHCQGTDLQITYRESYNGGGMVMTCQNTKCIARIWGHDEDDVIARWNRRTPGAATKAMLRWAKIMKETLESHDSTHSLLQGFRAFLAEWTETGDQ